MINEDQLEEQWELGNRMRFTIIITIEIEVEDSKLCIKRPRFEGAPKILKKYWDAGLSSVCMICLGIDYNQLREFSKRLANYVIYVGAYKSENHKYRVTNYEIRWGKICIHIILKCINYKEHH